MFDGLVHSGGGTLCGYQAGAMECAVERGIIVLENLKCMVMNSGGAGSGTFTLAKRFTQMREWPVLFDNRELISWRRWRNGPLMDINFLVDGILAKQAPNLEKEIHPSVPYFIAATRLPGREPHWFTRESGEPLFEQMRATATASGVSGPTVTINGVQYVDGCYSISLQDCVAKAFSEGATRVLVIDNASHGRTSPITKAILRWGVRNADPAVRAAVEYFCSTFVEPILPAHNVVVCRPKSLGSHHPLTRSARRLRATIEQGYKDMSCLQL